MNMKELVSKLLVDVLGEDKDKIEFPYSYMRFFGYITCAIITVMIVVIAFGGLPTKELGYIIILCLALIANFCFKPRFKAGKSYYLGKWDFSLSIGLIILTIVVGIRLVLMESFEWFDYLTYIIGIGLILEGVRRVEGKKKTLFYLVIGVIFLYIVFSDIQSVFNIEKGIFSKKGIYGDALVTIVDFVYAIIIFSLAFSLVRVDKLLNRLAFKITHDRRSGASAGLYAIWASTLYGAISGEARGNVEETGKNTIPVMKRAGYSSEFAASIEATISGVGQIVPPIMGTIAFAIMVMGKFSYSNIFLATIIPAILFMISLIIAATLEAWKHNLKPLTLQYTNEIKQQELEFVGEQKKSWLRSIISLFGFLIFFLTLWKSDFSLAGCALLATSFIVTSYIILPILFPKLNFQVKLEWLLKLIINSGKNGIDIVIYCVIIGIILFIFQQIDLSQFDLSQLIIHIFSWQLPLLLLVYKFIILLACTGIIIFLGMFLPTLVVFFLLASLMVPIFKFIEINELQTYLFVFYYSILAGITPPKARLLTKATELFASLYKENLDKEKLHKTSFRLSFVLFILPFAWIYHPEIIIQTNSYFSYYIIETIYVIIAILLAIFAISVAKFGLFRREKGSLSPNECRILYIAAALIILFSEFWLMFLGVVIILTILIRDDLQAKENSILKTSLPLVWLMMKPKHIPTSVFLTFSTLILVYTAYFTTSGFIFNLHEQTEPWLKDRFHFTLEVDNCNNVDTNEIKQLFLQETGKQVTIACTRTTDEAIIARLYPGELKLHTNLRIIEFDSDYFNLVPKLKTSLKKLYQEYILGDLGSCFEKTGIKLEQVNFDLNKQLTSKECNIFDETELPLIYIGFNVADITLDASTGTIVALHNMIFPDETTKENIFNLKQKFIVASVFETEFSDLDELIIVPKGYLAKIFPDTNTNITHQLIVKIENLNFAGEIDNIMKKIINSNNIPNYLTESNSIVDYEMWELQSEFLTTTRLILVVVFAICIFVLVSGISQLMENNKRLIVLMRLSGINNAARWMFIFTLSVISAFITCIIAFGLSYLLAEIFARFWQDIASIIDLRIFFDVLGATILTTLLTTTVLSHMHFSRDVARELDYASY
ncbi:TRAP transporter large permease subunit [Candidatus Halobeggiatoa sp. HSG11]|nr:TRAP transporter large permease subunit [Candidatus Halobeggiatoa sp. HSG11]